MKDSLVRAALVMPRSWGSQVAGETAVLEGRSLISLNRCLSTFSSTISGVSPTSVICTQRIICRMIDLDVLVVDGHALGPVDFLDFVEQEGLEGLVALDLQDVVGGDGALGELLARLDLVAVLDLDVLAARDEVLLVVPVLVLHDDLLVAAHPVAVLDECR